MAWNLELTDDNTLTLTGRVLGSRGGGGGGRRGGGGGRGFGRGPQQPIVLHRVK